MIKRGTTVKEVAKTIKKYGSITANGFAYNPNNKVDGIKICRCPLTITGIKDGKIIYSPCQLHPNPVDLRSILELR